MILQARDTADDYFLAGRHLSWWIIGGSIFASNIGSEHLVGLAGSGATDGVAMAHYELHAWCLLVLGWLLVPFYMRSRVFTMPEFLERRFNATSRWVLSLISLVAYVVTKIAVGIFAGGVVFQVLLPELRIGEPGQFLDRFDSGRRADGHLHGAGRHACRGLHRGDANGRARDRLAAGHHVWAARTGRLGRTAAHLRLGDVQSVEAARAGRRGSHLGTRQGGGADGVVLQRQLSLAEHAVLRTGDRAVVLVHGPVHRAAGVGCSERDAGAARSHFRCVAQAVAGVHLHHSRHDLLRTGGQRQESRHCNRSSSTADGQVIREHAQIGFSAARGTRAADRACVEWLSRDCWRHLMSSLAGVFNASATLFTIDFYSKIQPNVSQHRLVWIGRVATGVMVLIGLAWIPVIQGGKGLYDYLQGVQAYLAPPIFVVFFLGVFWKRLNGAGCLAALIVGFLLGLFRLAIDTPVKLIEGFKYTEGSFLWIINNMFFQYYSILILIVCAVTMIVGELSDERARLRGDLRPDVRHYHRRASRSFTQELGVA